MSHKLEYKLVVFDVVEYKVAVFDVVEHKVVVFDVVEVQGITFDSHHGGVEKEVVTLVEYCGE